ncbi:putative non-specific serine/threonine protein kinase [Helianthus annuus]|nr:putative non-specific serine/threonine protein kinase [Helianthus annuus]
MVRPILLRGSFGPKFACGFYCNGTCTSYLFTVFIAQTNSGGQITQPSSGFPQVVWSANRDHPVGYGAVLNLTATGELVLQDADGSIVWNTNTTMKSVAGLNLTDDGNLALFDVNSSVVWQSFDYPTDCLLPGQTLSQGQQLIPSVSTTNWTAQKGLFSLQVTDNGLYAYVGSNPPQAYYSKTVSGNNTNTGRRYVRFLNGSLSLFIFSVEPSDPDQTIYIPPASSAQYMKLMPNGHLLVFEGEPPFSVVADLLNGFLGECNYPMACGKWPLLG